MGSEILVTGPHANPLLPSTGGTEERENSVMTAFHVAGNRPLRQPITKGFTGSHPSVWSSPVLRLPVAFQ